MASPARDVVWTHSWSDELPLTVAAAFRVPGGLSVKTLDGSTVAISADPLKAAIAVAPPPNSSFQNAGFAGFDAEGNLLLFDSDLNHESVLFFKPGHWSHEFGPGTHRVAEGCTRVVNFRNSFSSTFFAFDSLGRVRPFDRSRLSVYGFVSQPACYAWGVTPSGRALLVRVDDGAQTPLTAVPISWLDSWGTADQHSFAYFGRDKEQQLNYYIQSPESAELRVAANGQPLASCFATESAGQSLRWAVLEQQLAGRRLRGFSDDTLQWEVPLDTESSLVNCRIHQKSGDTHQYRELDLELGTLGPAMPVLLDGQPCAVPVPEFGLAVCQGAAHRFSIGTSTIQIGEALRFASLSSRGYRLTPNSSQTIVGFRLTEQHGQLRGQLEWRTSATGAVERTTAEYDLGLPYDPTVRYIPQIRNSFGADGWLITLNRTRGTVSQLQIPLIFRESGLPTILRDALGAPAEISNIVESAERLIAVRSNPDELLEWNQPAEPASKVALGTNPGLSGIAGGLTIVSDFAGSTRRLRALVGGQQQWSRPIGANCRITIRGDNSIYLLCATTNQPPRAFYTAIRIDATTGTQIWERTVLNPDPNVSSFGNYVAIRDDELQILGSGTYQMLPNSSFARLRNADGGIMSVVAGPGYFAVREVSDLPGGLAAETGLGIGFGHRLLRGLSDGGLASFPIVEPDFRLQTMFSDASTRWFTVGRFSGQAFLDARVRPPASVAGAVGMTVEPTTTNAPDGFQDYLVHLTGDTQGDFGRIRIRLSRFISDVLNNCGSSDIRYGTPTRIEVSTPFLSCTIQVRVPTGRSEFGNNEGFNNESSLDAELDQPYRFHEGTVTAGARVSSGLRSGFEPF